MVELGQILSLLKSGMTETLHWFPEDVAPSRLAAILVGMANRCGGKVILGVAPRSGEIIGLRHPEAAIDRVFQAALLAEPPLVLPFPVIRVVEEARLLSVTIPPGLPHVYSLEGRYLGREGTQTNPLPAPVLRQLLVERGAVQFESQSPPAATLADLDPLKIEAYLAAVGQNATAPFDFLLRRGCLVSPTDDKQRIDDDRRLSIPSHLLPTYASLLLFGRNPQQWLPSATILAARFPGVAFSDRFVKQEIRGTLPDQLRQAEAFVRDNLRSVARLVGLTRQETPEYPLEAVRELLVNAVAHRDYNLQGDCIHLHLFADRLEVHSPGGLPGPVNLDNLLEARFSRNAVVVQVLSDLGFVERLGYGLDRVVTVLKQNNLRPPQFEEVAGSFRVTLFCSTETHLETQSAASLLAKYAGIEVNSRQQIALNYLALHGRITSGDYQSLCPDVHSESLRRDLADLVRRGILIKVGDKKATYYILK